MWYKPWLEVWFTFQLLFQKGVSADGIKDLLSHMLRLVSITLKCGHSDVSVSIRGMDHFYVLRAERAEMTRCDVQLCISLSICVCLPPALSFGCVCWAGHAGGFCHALIPGVCFWVKVRSSDSIWIWMWWLRGFWQWGTVVEANHPLVSLIILYFMISCLAVINPFWP